MNAATLVRYLDSAYAGPAWHGPALAASVRGVDADEAHWRPAAGRHCVREEVLHAAYAKHRVARRVDPTLRERFPRRLASAWWPAIDPATSWDDDRRLLAGCHRLLVTAVTSATAARLATRRPRRTETIAEELLGAAAHDAYHAGQIRLIRKLRAREGVSA